MKRYAVAIADYDGSLRLHIVSDEHEVSAVANILIEEDAPDDMISDVKACATLEDLKNYMFNCDQAIEVLEIPEKT